VASVTHKRSRTNETGICNRTGCSYRPACGCRGLRSRRHTHTDADSHTKAFDAYSHGYDPAIVVGTSLVLGVIFVGASFLVDLAYGYVDPRIRYD